ncbi:MAG: EfeM/EfeO family lipoprotein [Solirubrobacteraceae bacterium]
MLRALAHSRLARSRATRRALGLALVAAILLFAGAALAPSPRAHRPSRFGVLSVTAHTSPANPLGVRISKVYGSNVPARRYGTEIGDLEDQGENTRGEMTADLSPLPARSFVGPVAAYKRYAEHWTTVAEHEANGLRAALASSDRAGARSAWQTTWGSYLHLGAVYGLFGDLNQEIDGMPNGVLAGVADPHFSGLHRLEMGLWSGASPRSLLPVADALLRNLQSLRRTLPSVQIPPLEYATRAHEILEDAQRDLLSGTHVPWSGQGVLGTAAGLDATEDVFRTLQPLLSGRENTEAEVRSELGLLSSAIAQIHYNHKGWPTLTQLSMHEHELLNGTLAGALTALELLPGTLETKVSAPVPRLPTPSTAERATEQAAEDAP